MVALLTTVACGQKHRGGPLSVTLDFKFQNVHTVSKPGSLGSPLDEKCAQEKVLLTVERFSCYFLLSIFLIKLTLQRALNFKL